MVAKQRYAIIVAGGNGSRMGTHIPKQFIEVAGKPILVHTIRQFHRFDKTIQIILVLPADQQDYWMELVERIRFNIPHQVAVGGETRFHSVKSGLSLVDGEALVAVHDGVRPLVSHKTIANCFSGAEEFGACIPVVPMVESLRYRNNDGNKAVDRSHYFSVQTPQVFHSDLLTKAYEQEFLEEFTDDASVVEHLGKPIHIVDGNPENIKITRPLDLKIAGLLLKEQ